MAFYRLIPVLTSVLLLTTLGGAAQEVGNENWPSFRGPAARGLASGFETPVRWNAETDSNVLWRKPIPGLAHSSPVIWGDRLFVTTAVSPSDKELKVGLYGDIQPVEDDSEQSWRVYALNKNSGEILWEKEAHKGVPRIKRHPKSTHANPTPATDGRHLVVFFGSEGLYCYDLDGKLLWKKDLGLMDSGFFRVPTAQWGVATSPIIHDGVVYLQADNQKNSFLAAFDVTDGREIWRTPRQDVPTWSTPAVATVDGRTLIIVNGYRHIGAYDASDGSEVWKLVGGGDIPVPTPQVDGDLVFITNAHGRQAPIYAIKTKASGDISLRGDQLSNEAVVWSTRRSGGYMQTPIIVGDLLYVCRDNGVLGAYHTRTGERAYQERLGAGGGFSASAVSADGKLYYSSEVGDIYVVKAGPTFELLAVNPMGETTMSTPAVSEGVLYFRTRGHVVAVGRE